MYGGILCVRSNVCVPVCVAWCWYDFDTHLDMVVSSIFTLQNTATSNTPAMAAVNRTPPTKPPTAAPTPVLKQSQAVKLYIHMWDG